MKMDFTNSILWKLITGAGLIAIVISGLAS